ncbi:MAG: hypothetical protein HYY51_00165 [Candidatus Magasanikbacteria bacterium]|nr:hypothetical protein [Candidatus Magasanikbacteria bacterium]
MDTLSPEKRAEQERESIVSSILASAEREPADKDIPSLVVFRYGSKELDLVYFADKGTFSTAVEGYEDRERKPEETRFLYMAAKRAMQEIADRSQTEIEYTLETSNEKIVPFAQSHGKEIFRWDSETKEEFEIKKRGKVDIWYFKKTFKPL